LLGLVTIFCSCQKDITVKTEECQSVTFLIDRYTSNWVFIRTDTSYHINKACAEDLVRFIAYPALQLICGETAYMRKVIGNRITYPQIFNASK
jgi:hypothetical protein